MDSCTTCETPYKTGVFGQNQPLSKAHIVLINEYREPANRQDTYCEKCGKAYSEKAKVMLSNELQALKKKIQGSLGLIKLLSIEHPFGWEYESVDMLSAQSVTGTGVMSELSADFNDLFGGQSKTLSGKLKGGEDFCKSQLRLQAAELGCHAVVGIDIDYSEVGSLRGMMMVCMAGTAVRLSQTAVLGEKASETEELLSNSQRANFLGRVQRAL